MCDDKKDLFSHDHLVSVRGDLRRCFKGPIEIIEASLEVFGHANIASDQTFMH